MRRRTEDDSAAMATRWMLSWSDFVTLLLVVFAAMYANVPLSSRELTPATLPLKQASDKQVPVKQVQPASPEISQLTADLERALTNANNGKFSARIIPTQRGLMLELDAPLLFASGDAQLSIAALPVLAALSLVLRTRPYPVVIEGYADSIPIHTRKFPSNWELSSARASTVARFFADKGLAQARLRVVGQSANLPLADNQTPDARRQNRRVSILIELSPADRA